MIANFLVLLNGNFMALKTNKLYFSSSMRRNKCSRMPQMLHAANASKALNTNKLCPCVHSSYSTLSSRSRIQRWSQGMESYSYDSEAYKLPGIVGCWLLLLAIFKVNVAYFMCNSFVKHLLFVRQICLLWHFIRLRLALILLLRAHQ